MAGKVYAISDTHFCHANIVKYCNRPFKDVREMDEILIRNWNETVDQEDIVYHLGDFGFGKVPQLADIYSRLNGHKRLIMGNHDGTMARMKKIGFEEDHIYRTHRELFDMGSTKAFLFMVHDPDHYNQLVRWKHDVILYGHCHNNHGNKYATMKGWVNCCVENWDYRPVLLETLIEQGLTKNG